MFEDRINGWGGQGVVAPTALASVAIFVVKKEIAYAQSS
jgi:hypothetical protein